MLDGDGGPCCVHGTVPGGESECGITFLTKYAKVDKEFEHCENQFVATHKSQYNEIFYEGKRSINYLWVGPHSQLDEFRPKVFVTLRWLDFGRDSIQ